MNIQCRRFNFQETEILQSGKVKTEINKQSKTITLMWETQELQIAWSTKDQHV